MVAMKKAESITKPDPEVVKGLRVPRGKIRFSLPASCLRNRMRSDTPTIHKPMARLGLFITPD